MMGELEMSNMYSDTKTWNPAVGCNYDCVYCEKSFKRQLRRVAAHIGCQDCYDYKPHYHPERLGRIPSSPIVFVCGTGDISFYESKFVWRIFRAIDAHKPRIKKTYYFQSKNPSVFNSYLDWFNGNQDKVILLTTLETNRDEIYGNISKAPFPTTRFHDFLDLEYSRKVVTIEPVLDFDPDIFLRWMRLLKDQGTLEYVWFGFDSKNCGLPEPSTEKAQRFVDKLQAYGIEVKGKTLRDVVLVKDPYLTHARVLLKYS